MTGANSDPPKGGAELAAAAPRELIAMVDKRQPGEGSSDALKLLAGMETAESMRVVAAVATDRSYPADMRATAAVAMGRSARPEHQAALEIALGDPDPLVLRRSAEALGRVGNASAHRQLLAVKLPEDPPARRALLFARALLAHRLGLEAEDVVHAGTIDLAPGKSTDLLPRPLDGETVARIVRGLHRELPALPVAPGGGVALTCGNSRLAVVPHAAVMDAAGRNFVPAVVLRQAPTMGVFGVFLYILSRPAGGDRLSLSGFRPDGTMSYAGEARLGRTPRFTLAALAGQLAIPLQVEGHVDPNGSLVLDRALLQDSRARVTGRPTPAKRPVPAGREA